MIQIALKLQKKTLDEKLVLCQTFGTKLPGNPHVADPNPSVAALTAQRTAILAKRADLVATRALARQLEADLAGQEKVLDDMLTTEAATIESATGGDEAKILTTGAPLRRKRQPIGPLGAPQKLTVTGGELEGTLKSRWATMRGASSYTAEHSLSATGPFTQFYVGAKTTAIAPGLVSGTMYYVRVNAIGTHGRSPWSDIAQKRAT